VQRKAAVTVNRPREDVERLWRESPGVAPADAAVTFVPAPGDHGTEIHADLGSPSGTDRIGEAIRGIRGTTALAKVKDQLRHFKQRVETGEIPRSDGAPEGERVERKLKQRPAQPLDGAAREKAGV